MKYLLYIVPCILQEAKGSYNAYIHKLYENAVAAEQSWVWIYQRLLPSPLSRYVPVVSQKGRQC